MGWDIAPVACFYPAVFGSGNVGNQVRGAKLINAAVVNLPVLGLCFWWLATSGTIQRKGASPGDYSAPRCGIFIGSAWHGDDFDSKLRQVSLLPVSQTSGHAIAVRVAATILLFHVFVWIFGGSTGVQYFQFLGWSVPTVLVGLAIRGYHQRLAQEEAGQVRKNVNRRSAFNST